MGVYFVKGCKELSKYIVYKAAVLGETVYIGSGVFGREKHCTSGCSHVYELNKYHFEGVSIDVSIIRKGLTKEESLAIEKEYILSVRPRLNKVHLTKDNLKAAQISIFLVQRLNQEFNIIFEKGKRETFKTAIAEIITFLGVSNLITGINIPKERDSRYNLESSGARTLYSYITRKEFKEKYRTWLETAFEYKSEGYNVWLKIREYVLYDLQLKTTI